jgi:decaprenyl-phosphate phosphoribosyltransferase
MKHYLKVIRPSSLVKSITFFIPAFFSRSLFDLQAVTTLIITGFGFYLVCASIYIVNDLKDVEYDRLHPVKKNRPIASGKLNEFHAYIFAFLLLLTGLASQFWINEISMVIKYNAAYLIMNLLYINMLKNIKYVDVTVIALGFLLRVLYADEIMTSLSSEYLFICIFAASLILGYSKRLGDIRLQKNNETFRKVKYTVNELNAIIRYSALILVITFVIYLNIPETSENLNGVTVLPGSILALIGGLYFIGKIDTETNLADPIYFLFKDVYLLVICGLFITWYSVSIYLPNVFID